jgi:hypothetical protein
MNMRRLHGLNIYRGEIYQQLLLTKARAKADAEKVKSEATEQATSKVDGTTATPDADSMDVMQLDDIKSGNVAPKQEDSNVKAKLEASDHVTENFTSPEETEIIPYNSASKNDIDYSIHPPGEASIAADNKNENDVCQLETTNPTEMDVTDVSCIDARKAAKHITGATMNIVADTNIVTDEAMVLPAIGSDHTLVHRNNETAAAHVGGIENVNVESLSNRQTTIHHQNITPDCHVKVEQDFGDNKSTGSAMTPAIKSETTATDGKENNIADIKTEPTTVVGEDSNVGVKVEFS